MSSARATMAAWLAAEPSSSSRPLQLACGRIPAGRPGPRLRAIRMALSGSARASLAVAGQVAQQAVVEVLQVVQPLAQIGVARLAEAGAVLGAHPLDRRLGGQAGAHRLLQGVVPAAAVGEHPVGFEHLEGGADQAVVALQHVRRSGPAGRRWRRSSRASSAGDVVGQQLRSAATGASCSTATPKARPSAKLRALQPLGPVRRDLDVLQLARGRAARRRRPSRPAPWR